MNGCLFVLGREYLDSVRIDKNHKIRKSKDGQQIVDVWNYRVLESLRGLLAVVEGDVAHLSLFLEGTASEGGKGLKPTAGPGLALLFAVATTCHDEEVLKRYLYVPMQQGDSTHSSNRLLHDVSDALLSSNSHLNRQMDNQAQKLKYTRLLEAVLVLAIARKSGDQKRTLRSHFSVSTEAQPL